MWNSRGNFSGPGWQSIRRMLGGGAPVIPDAANLRGYLEGDNLDGSNNSTLVNGMPVASVVNLGTLGGTFDQLVALNMPTFSTTAGPGGAKPALTFDGNDWLVSSLPASAWTFLHDGTGATIYTVAKTSVSGTGILVATSTGGGRGIQQRVLASFVASYFMHDGVGVQVNLNSAAAAVVSGSFNLLASTLTVVDTPDAGLYIQGGLVASGNAGAFSSANGSLLSIGANPSGTGGLAGSYRRTAIFQGAHDATLQAAVIAWMQGLDAVTYPAP